MKKDLLLFLTTFQEMHNAWKALDATPVQSANANVAYNNFTVQLKELAMQADRLNYTLPAQFALTLQEVCDQGREFSNSTFGELRPFTGPLHHLLKEVQEVIDGDGDLSEFADCLLLLLDAFRLRYPEFKGIEASTLLSATLDKIEINRKRTWGTPDANGVIQHVKTSHSDNYEVIIADGYEPPTNGTTYAQPANLELNERARVIGELVCLAPRVDSASRAFVNALIEDLKGNWKEVQA